MEMKYEEKEVEKPIDWPANAREKRLEEISEQVEKFVKEPSYKTREVLLALVSEHDLNQNVTRGLVRVTEYEVYKITNLYCWGTICQINSLRTYLYDIIAQTIMLQKSIQTSGSLRILPYEQGLPMELKLFFYVYQRFITEKDKTFADQLLEFIEESVKKTNSKEEVDDIVSAYASLLLDFSNMHGSKREKLWQFTREELFELFLLEAKILKQSNQFANTRPIKGILIMQISNFILKSRHGYNNDHICKYLPTDVAKESIINHQIWMKKTELLNDKREQKVVPELFTDTSWLKYDWIENIDFSAKRTYYVACFSKSINSNNMRTGYGECLYGYKNDRIIDLIGPIGIKKLDTNSEIPFISQVPAFDVLYDINEAKEELQYLFSIIDMFYMSNNDKKQFLEEIMQYWILSVKDYSWYEERERRYVLFLYNDYNYKEMEIDDTFLKVKTALFVTPDFVIGKNPSKKEIAIQLEAKRKFLYSREYLFCNECLMQDHDVLIFNKPDKCPVCGSRNIKLMSYD